MCEELEAAGLLETSVDNPDDKDVRKVTDSLTTREKERLEEWLAERDE